MNNDLSEALNWIICTKMGVGDSSCPLFNDGFCIQTAGWAGGRGQGRWSGGGAGSTACLGGDALPAEKIFYS